MTDAQALEAGRRRHFYRRVRERIGPHVDAKALWRILVDQITQGPSDHLKLIGRVTKDGRRLWRFSLDGRWHIVLFDHADNHPVTILPPTGRLYRAPGCGSSINLAHYS